MKTRSLSLIIMAVLIIAIAGHGMRAVAQCSCAGNFYGSYVVSGSYITCSACAGGVAVRNNCDSSNQCSQTNYCTGGCRLGCFCAACSTFCDGGGFQCPCRS